MKLKVLLFIIFIIANFVNAKADFSKLTPDNYKLNNLSKKLNVISSSIINKNIKVDTIIFKSDEYKITGLLFTNQKKSNKKAIVIGHGYYNPKSYKPGLGTFETGKKLCEEGYTVIIPDYRGYYKSTGGHSYFYSGESVDLLNAANILKMQYKITDIYLIGYSWGGGISLFAAESFAAVSEKLFQKIVLYYPQLGGLDISQREYLFLKAKFGFSGKQIFDLFRKKSPLYNYHKLSKIPILIFHGKQDKVVKLNQSSKLFEFLKSADYNCDLKIFDDYGHAFADSPENKSWDNLVKFLEK